MRGVLVHVSLRAHTHFLAPMNSNMHRKPAYKRMTGCNEKAQLQVYLQRRPARFDSQSAVKGRTTMQRKARTQGRPSKQTRPPMHSSDMCVRCLRYMCFRQA